MTTSQKTQAPQTEEAFAELLATTYADGDDRKAWQIMETIRREEERRKVLSQYRAFIRTQNAAAETGLLVLPDDEESL